MHVTTTAVPATFAGFPGSSWAFAFRIWIAVVIALYASFWLQLGVPSTAAITVAILATPTRGQALEKAGFRLIGTVVGVSASIVMMGAFAQARDLILVAFAVWIGLCVYVAGLSDGNRSYAAVLSGYTVALIAIQQLDMPHQVFDAGVQRGAAIAVGIAAVALVNDLLAAPDRHAGLGAELAALHRRVRDEARAILRGTVGKPSACGALLAAIAGLRSEIETLAPESASGSTRRAAARTAAVALVAELHAVQLLGALPVALGSSVRNDILKRLDDPAWRGLPEAIDHLDSNGAGLEASSLGWALRNLLRYDDDVREALAALAAGRTPSRQWRTPFYRSHRVALAAGLRAAMWLAMTSTLYVIAGWPSSDTSLSLVAVVIGLGATTPDPRRFTLMALIAAPIAIVVGGVLEFLVLDGVSQFPLLALALLPVIGGVALLTTVRNPLLAALSRLNLIFVLGVLAPANPQSWDPQTYLFTSLFVCVAASLLFAAQLLVPPVTADQRRQWLLAAARREAPLSSNPSADRWRPEEALFRDAVRIALMARPGTAGDDCDPVLEEAVRLFGEAGALRLCGAHLALLKNKAMAARARAALKARDFEAVRQAARSLRDAPDHELIEAGAALHTASLVLEGR